MEIFDQFQKYQAVLIPVVSALVTLLTVVITQWVSFRSGNSKSRADVKLKELDVGAGAYGQVMSYLREELTAARNEQFRLNQDYTDLYETFALLQVENKMLREQLKRCGIVLESNVIEDSNGP